MALLVASTMMASNIGPAFASGEYSSGSDKYFNSLDVKPAKLEDGQSVKDLIKNPDQAEIYTFRNEFRIPADSGRKQAYQAYVASVGKNITEEEKAKIDKTVDLPKITGYEAPDEYFDVDYDEIVYNAGRPVIWNYNGIGNSVKVKHVFQDINDFEKYGLKPGENQDIYSQPSGSTGSTLQIPSLQDSQIKGFVPEASTITVQLPADPTDYVVEYRYNRAHYDVTFDTDGGTPVESRSFFYGQKILALVSSEIPTKTGYKLVGWKANVDLEGDSSNYSAGATISDINGLKMPAIPVQFTAVWEADSSQIAKTPEEKDQYTVTFNYGNGRSNKTQTVSKGNTITEPRIYEYKGHTFMGWKWVEKSPDGQPPVLYSLNNKVNSDATLEAIWVKNDRVDVNIYHYFLDENGNLDANEYPNPLEEKLYDKRVGDYTFTVGDQISDKWKLISGAEISKSSDSKISGAYDRARQLNPSFDNNYFQKIKVTENGPNEFYFFYRPFKTRDYKVNYLDKDSNKQIANQEEVKSECQDFDVKNYRPIKGWVLDKKEKPQKQLFFDVDPESQELIGINGTKTNEITFYYKDVRIIEVPDNSAPLEGYVRVNFKADEGGSFGKDTSGNDIKELHYYVIKGLKSDFLPVPKELKQGETQDPDKYYITADKGKNFKEWADSPLLNPNVIIEKDYTFTAKFDWSGLQAKPMVRTEAYKDPNGEWTNNFAPTIDQLKGQIVWMEDGQEKALPSGATVTFEGINSKDDVYEKLKELGRPDKDEVFRTVTFKAKVEFSDKKNTKEIDLPIIVYKNRYEALTSGDKPLPLSEAEKKTEAEGGLKDITGNYIKVTVNPSNKPDNKDSKIYYVNPNAWVDIPEIKLTDEDKAKIKFLNWTSDNDAINTDDKYIFEKENVKQRYKFTKDTIISPVSAEDVVEQKGTDKPNVPESYVKVIVKTTDNATDESKFERTFWVDPLNKVEINVDKPIGKKIETDTTPYTLTFSKWQTDDKSKFWTDKILGQFENDTTILAKYSTTFEKIKDQVPTTDKVNTPQGKVPTLDEIKAKITPPEGKQIASVEYITNGEPDISKDGEAEAKVIVKYTDGSTAGTETNPIKVKVEVHKNIIPSYDGNMPEGALNNYVKITFKAGTGGTIFDKKKKAYYVSPEVEADMTSIADNIEKTPHTGYVKAGWDTSDTKKLKDTFKNDTNFTFKFTPIKNIIEKTDENVKKPEGYAEVIFSTDGNGKLDGDKDKITYYVNPEAGVKIVEGRAGENEIPVPKPKANKNYEFYKWFEELDTVNVIKQNKHYVANFNLVNVTLNYDPNGGTGKGPDAKTVKYGSKEFLANQEKLTKANHTFLGWKLSTDNTDKIYEPGDPIILNENTTAIAQWQIIQHTVKFDTKGGSKVDDQKVDHGSTATKPSQNPKKPGFVFMGWKEKGKEGKTDPYYDFKTEITKDKTLVAIWDVAVKEIDEDDPVEDQYIKVVFKEGGHGKLQLDDKDQTKPVAYKVGKDLSFEEAVEYGMLVPDIKPNEYYKAQQANEGWDNPLVLNKADITFTAAYEIESNVIPIKPEKTDKQIKDETPDDMIVVDFKVDGNRAYLLGTDKFYVKRNQLVNIKAPLVVKTDITYNFKAWDLNTEDVNNQVSFTTDTTIREAKEEKPDMEIKSTAVGLDFIELRELTDGAVGHIILTRGDQNFEFTNVEITKTIKQGRRIRQEVIKGFDLTKQGIALESGDKIQYYATNGNLQSVVREIIVR